MQMFIHWQMHIHIHPTYTCHIRTYMIIYICTGCAYMLMCKYMNTLLSVHMVMFAITTRMCLSQIHIARTCMVWVICSMAGADHCCIHAIERTRHNAPHECARQLLHQSHPVCVCVCVRACVPEQGAHQQSDHNSTCRHV